MKSYIVVPILKLLFEVYGETDEEDYEELFSYAERDDFVDASKSINSLSLNDLSFLIRLQHAVIGIHPDKVFLFLLKKYDKDCYVIGESQLDEKGGFKDYKIVKESDENYGVDNDK